MSQEKFTIKVPKTHVKEFCSKYYNLVETFYCVKLFENKVVDKYFVYYDVSFTLNPETNNFDPKDTLDKIQKYVESGLGVSHPEAGEDSSYDSEEDEGSHRAASRTPSDTLAAEFAEYVTVSPASPGTEFAQYATAPASPGTEFAQYATAPASPGIEFALKLGYSEQLARAALQRLGPEPAQDELLAELIKLGAMRPARASSPPPAQLEPARDTPQLRPIVIDGSNVAMSHGNKEVFSCRGIEICVDWFRQRGHSDVTVFVPKWRKEARRPDNPVADREVLERLERERVLVYTPSRLLAGKRILCYDDRYILRLAADTHGIVVSNDNYRDLAHENPQFRTVVEQRLLMYSFVNDRFMPPDDPLGRTGPNLDAFLRFPSQTETPPACPYGRKCTYGNKCKYHHPERAGRPHKSVAERLSERAAQALRARDLHTLSLPPGGRPSEANKRLLTRAQSATPRLPDSSLTTHFDMAQAHLMPGPSQDTNPHRKLARQLTLNPAYDPRLGGYARGAMHEAAARVASAPVGAGAEGALGSEGPGAVSEGALQLWEARRRMHYHLAGIFPEAQVREAMQAHPAVTDPQTMCAIILARYRPQ